MNASNGRWKSLGIALSVLFMLAAAAGADQGTAPPPPLKPGMRIVRAAPVKVSQPLRSQPAVMIDAAAPSAARAFQDRRLKIPKTVKGKAAGIADSSIVQNRPVGNSMPTAAASFEGVGNISGILPPDTQGDIGWDPATGKKYYVQWVNLAYQIWDVTNPAAPASLAGPSAGNTLWAGTGGLCESHNDGDPLTRFDALSMRWVMSQFALGFPNDFHQCIAVSKTADPTGEWYLYDFQTSTTLMNDYGKLGVWPDGYYMSFNQFNGSTQAWAGAGVAVFERDKMLLGQAARMIYIDTGAVTLNYGGLLPSDLDGSSPPAGTPNYFMEWDDSSWLGDASDTLRIWEFKTDWLTPANTTFGLNAAYDPNHRIATADVDPALCAGSQNCIRQPGTAQGLDPLSDRLMYRLQYRNFGGYQTLVGNHSVDASGADLAGIHWFELRDSGTGFAMNQQGVYAPDTDSRWMGSAAMDVSGNIALGYSVSSTSTYPSVRYTGRLTGDPAGTLPQGEATLVAGSGSQTHTAARWGDYSMMAVDPSDGCTFWYTQEYMQTTSSADWQTRIGSFRFPSCTSAPVGILEGTVRTDASIPLAGASIGIAGGYSTVTDAAGHYSLFLQSGTYEVTASKYGFMPATAAGVTVSAPGTTTRDFTLSVSPEQTVSGVVTDATTSWPLYARIDIAGYPGGPVFTNPVTGAYSVSLAHGQYSFTVKAMSGGYTTVTHEVSITADTVEHIGLAVNELACSAPGYRLISGTPVLAEGFDTSTAPLFSPAWGTAAVAGTTAAWATMAVSSFPAGIAPRSTPNMAVFNSWTADADDSARLYQTGSIDLSALANGEVSLWMYHDDEYTNADTLQVQVSTDAGISWNNAGAPIDRFNGTNGWARHRVNINPYTGAGMSDVRIALLATSGWGNDIHIDDLSVTGESHCTPTASGGLVIGAVRDANTGAVVMNASVRDAALAPATVIDASADPAAPARMYVIAQEAGVRTLTATAPRYAPSSVSPAVVAGGTVGQDIQLSTGRLSVSPTSLVFNLSSDAPNGALPLSIANDGGDSATFEIFTVPGTYPGYAPTGPFAANTRHIGPKNLNDRDATKLRVNLTPTGITPLAAGDVSASFSTGLTSPWGIGFNTDANDLWVGNYATNTNHRFTTLGVNTGDTIDTPWADSFAADMAYNPLSNTLWQVNVAGDSCIYELDPASRTTTGNRICPPFGTSQRGLAFDPLSNTYYSGSWNDSIINHFAPDGTILDSRAVGLSISGLAFNPANGHLFVMTNAATVSMPSMYDLYVLDTRASYANLGGFNLMTGGAHAFADNSQAGLEIDCSGNLWAVDQDAWNVYVAPSGETGICNWQAGWLTVSPSSGNAPAGGTAPLTVSVNAAGLAPGTHHAYLRISNSSPYGPVIVPVTLNLTAMNRLTVTRDGTGSGTVTSTPGGISCGSDCTEAYAPDSVVVLHAEPDPGSTFSGWGGDPGCSGGTVTMDTAKVCSATFTVRTYTVLGSVPGGHGTVSCTSPVTHGSSSVCTISPAYGYALSSFSDDGVDKLSAVSANSYTITGITSDHLVSATFALIPPIRLPPGTIQGAYDAALDTGTIQAQQQTFVEEVVCPRPIAVTIAGGYNVDYTSAGGMTTIEGTLRIRNGTMMVSRLRIKKKLP